MSDDSRPTRRVRVPGRTDVVDALEQDAVEYLVVSDTQLVAIPGRTIFVLDVVEGTVDAATELEVQLWAPPPTSDPTDPPDVHFAEFVELLRPAEADLRGRPPAGEHGGE